MVLDGILHSVRLSAPLLDHAADLVVAGTTCLE